jgi:hypothetical protein
MHVRLIITCAGFDYLKADSEIVAVDKRYAIADLKV